MRQSLLVRVGGAKLRRVGFAVVVLLPALASALAFAEDQAETKKKSAETPAQSAPAPLLAPAAGPDSTSETFGDWSIVCSRQAGATDRVCEVNTAVLLRGQAAPFARVAVVRSAKDKPARMMALVPVNVSVGSPVKIGGDAGKLDVSLPFRSCVPAACVAEVELTKEQAQLLSAPAKAPAQIAVMDAAGRTATLQFSLRGLDQALDAYFKRQDK
jgi:invasion protein IalB